MVNRLKEVRFFILIPVLILSLVAFALSLVGTIVYAANCASEFNGGQVSHNAVGLNAAGTIFAGVALVIDVAALFLARSTKSASIFALSRIANYLAFMMLLGGFLYQILDEYSLLGTILYPIVSGAVGDPVDATLSTCYFISLIFVLVACLLSLPAGIAMRKKSHRIDANPNPQPKEANANE